MSDKKDAANIAVGLSSQLINASLTLIALSGAFFTFILDKKDPTAFFYVCYVATFVFLIFSIIFGGTGIARVKKDGEGGIWKTSGKPDWFNLQTIALLLGIFSIFMLPFTGNKKKESPSAVESLMKSSAKTDSLLIENLKVLKGNQQHNDSTPATIIKHRDKKIVDCTPKAETIKTKDQLNSMPRR